MVTFNIHVDVADDVNTVRLHQLLQSFGFILNASKPTHNAGHILDLVISRRDVEVTDLSVGDLISDHAFIRFSLHVQKPSSAADVQSLAEHGDGSHATLSLPICRKWCYVLTLMHSEICLSTIWFLSTVML